LSAWSQGQNIFEGAVIGAGTAMAMAAAMYGIVSAVKGVRIGADVKGLDKADKQAYRAAYRAAKKALTTGYDRPSTKEVNDAANRILGILKKHSQIAQQFGEKAAGSVAVTTDGQGGLTVVFVQRGGDMHSVTPGALGWDTTPLPAPFELRYYRTMYGERLLFEAHFHTGAPGYFSQPSTTDIDLIGARGTTHFVISPDNVYVVSPQTILTQPRTYGYINLGTTNQVLTSGFSVGNY
jgi:hypothetical protein